jgi:hypothetical protein
LSIAGDYVGGLGRRSGGDVGRGRGLEAQVVDALEHDQVGGAGNVQDVAVEPVQRVRPGSIADHLVAADAGVDHAPDPAALRR